MEESMDYARTEFLAKDNPETAYKFDGKDYPLKGSPLADTISAKRINERTGESVWKKDGKVILTTRTVISADGKTLNLTRTGKDAQGRTVDDVMVYENSSSNME